MSERRRRLDPGTALFHRGDEVAGLYVVVAGAIELVRPQANGAALVLQRAVPGSILAEASLYSSRYHCDAVATLPSEVAVTARPTVAARLATDVDFARSWAAHLAREVQAARYRSEVLALRTVAERLDAWFAWGERTLPAKGEWKSLAAHLGVSPEALYRELSKRRQSGRRRSDTPASGP